MKVSQRRTSRKRLPLASLRGRPEKPHCMQTYWAMAGTLLQEGCRHGPVLFPDYPHPEIIDEGAAVQARGGQQDAGPDPGQGEDQPPLLSQQAPPQRKEREGSG